MGNLETRNFGKRAELEVTIDDRDREIWGDDETEDGRIETEKKHVESTKSLFERDGVWLEGIYMIVLLKSKTMSGGLQNQMVS